MSRKRVFSHPVGLNCSRFSRICRCFGKQERENQATIACVASVSVRFRRFSVFWPREKCGESGQNIENLVLRFFYAQHCTSRKRLLRLLTVHVDFSILYNSSYSTYICVWLPPWRGDATNEALLGPWFYSAREPRWHVIVPFESPSRWGTQ